jgi:hypothetical protein
MNLELARCPDALDRRLDLVKQGQYRAGIARMALGHPVGTDKARRWLGEHTGLAPTLGGAIPLAFHDGRHGGVIRIDDCTVAELFALREPLGLLPDVRRAAHRRGERLGETLALGLAERGRPVQELLSLVPKVGDGLAKLQELLLRVAYQFHKDVPLPSALAAKAPHDFFQLLVEGLGLPREARGVAAALLRDVFDELQGFFCALYSVVASVTRWLPGAEGKVSIRRWAGLTRPSARAAAAWRATNSSIRASSRRLLNWAKVSGKTKYSWGLASCTSSRPQAYMTATSVRKRSPMASSEAPTSGLSNSSASKTRVGTGRRPPLERLGKRLATLCSTAATNLAQGNVSAHLRMALVVGTTSATWRRGPLPLSQCGRWRHSRIVSSPSG